MADGVIVIRDGRRVKRPVSRLIAYTATLVASAILCIISLVIPARSVAAVGAKIAIFYLSIVVEFVSIAFNFYIWAKPSSIVLERITVRYGSLTIVIVYVAKMPPTELTSQWRWLC